MILDNDIKLIKIMSTLVVIAISLEFSINLSNNIIICFSKLKIQIHQTSFLLHAIVDFFESISNSNYFAS